MRGWGGGGWVGSREIAKHESRKQHPSLGYQPANSIQDPTAAKSVITYSKEAGGSMEYVHVAERSIRRFQAMLPWPLSLGRRAANALELTNGRKIVGRSACTFQCPSSGPHLQAAPTTENVVQLASNSMPALQFPSSNDTCMRTIY